MLNREYVLSVIESGIANLKLNEEKINNLNVFPVPDGDTGTNMINTLMGGWNSIKSTSNNLLDILRDFSIGSLMSARGNSGVITSQIIKGIYEGYKKIDLEKNAIITRKEFKIILNSAKEYAYRAVENPVEGTILSVLKKMDSEFKDQLKDVKSVFKSLHYIAQEGTKETKNQLSVLKEANVVDSGAFGLTVIIEGCLLALNNKPLKLNVADSLEELTNIRDVNLQNQLLKADPNKNIGYCTEFILTLKEPNSFNKDNFIKKLKEIGGDSIVAIHEDDIFKVHVHIKRPGEVFNLAQNYGEFIKIKSENMATQVSQKNHEITENNIFLSKSITNVDKNKLGIIAVVDGDGIKDYFKSLGVDYIISGGQSMNPSVKDFIDAVSKINNYNIVLLPNNHNIILAAKLVKKTFKGKRNIFVLPTKTIQQGIVALYNINKEMVDFKHYEKNIRNSIKNISEAEITKSIKTVDIDNINVKQDDYLLVSNKKILKTDKTIMKILEYFIEKKIKKNDEIEILTVFFGKTLLKDKQEEITSFIKNNLIDIEVEIKYGGQDIYDLIILGE